ncbi:YolD-like family protein [Psychrobacillus vulpis]|uniref:YolD-like family protein n=1 Tax=Psychrobacillus vulpis TaxID=2325572 RepID=A0A544TUB8_9BACI|nr:YolD-like family protein [Psychrobacillus vulpis]TQR21038.1 YolD-like family protein [Psychrobacillus vulpis]
MSYFDGMMDEKLDLSKVRDRGSKKWVAMMLPEHVKMLREYNENMKKMPKPELDEWDLATIQEQIEIALKRNVEIEFKLWKEGEIICRVCRIERIDLNKKIIEVENIYRSFTLKIEDIVSITILE